MNDTTEYTYSVEELLGKISGLLNSNFPDEIWVEGVIQGYAMARSGHTYFNLTSKVEEAGATPEFSINVTLFKWARQTLKTNLQLEDELEVRIRGKLNIYSPRSSIQLNMTAIDEEYTISKMAKNKEVLLAALKEEGLIELNKALPVPQLPLKVALITSDGSAAHNDFVHELAQSDFSWQVLLIHSSVQGENAPAEICAALDKAQNSKADVVALIRGGGSQIDLAAFDTEEVARKIASLSLPVFAGIGHEIDISVADYVAHTTEKTPTACAARLVELVEQEQNNMLELGKDIFQRVDYSIQQHTSHLKELGFRASLAPAERLSEENARLASSKVQLNLLAAQMLEQGKNYLATSQKSLSKSTKGLLKQKSSQVGTLKKQIQSLDPKKFLKRGWSITKTVDGKLVKDSKDVKVGAELVTQVSKGTIHSKVVN